MKKTYIIPETITSEKIILSDICGTSPTVTGDGTGTNPPGWGGYDDGTRRQPYGSGYKYYGGGSTGDSGYEGYYQEGTRSINKHIFVCTILLFKTF